MNPPAENERKGDWLPPIPWDVLRAKCFTPVQGRVLFVLWARCNAKGECYPGLKALSREAGCDERTVKITVDTLEHHGVITVTREEGKSHTYHLEPEHILAFARSHATPLKNVGGTKLTPLNFVPPPPSILYPEPPSKLGDEEEPSLEEEPEKKNQDVPSPSVPTSLPSVGTPVLQETAAPAPPEPKRRTAKAKTPKADGDPRGTLVTQARLAIERQYGPFGNPGKENAALHKLFGLSFWGQQATVEQAVACYRWVKGQRTYRDRYLPCSVMADNFGEWLRRNGLDRAPPAPEQLGFEPPPPMVCRECGEVRTVGMVPDGTMCFPCWERLHPPEQRELEWLPR